MFLHCSKYFVYYLCPVYPDCDFFPTVPSNFYLIFLLSIQIIVARFRFIDIFAFALFIKIVIVFALFSVIGISSLSCLSRSLFYFALFPVIGVLHYFVITSPGCDFVLLPVFNILDLPYLFRLLFVALFSVIGNSCLSWTAFYFINDITKVKRKKSQLYRTYT